MLQVKQIVNRIYTSNSYLVFDDEYNYCWLIDIGDYEMVADVIPNGKEVRGVFLTHTHFDHLYGINALHRDYPQCRVYTSVYGKQALYDEKMNFSKYHQSSLVYEGTDVGVLYDGDNIEIYPGIFLTAYETPGHCPSCLTYVLNNWVFTGDSFIFRVKVVTKLPKGDRFLAKESLEKIMSFSQGKMICPGHGNTGIIEKN